MTGVSPAGAGLSPTAEPVPVSSAVAASIPDADEIIAGVCVSMHPKLEAIVHQYCDEAYGAIMDSVRDYLIDNAKFNIASMLESERRQKEYYRHALKAIQGLEAGRYEFPADWQQQIDRCPECEKYRGHPIQQGICNEHRQPIWNREKHESHEAKAIGHRARRIAEEALGGYWHDTQGIEAQSATTAGRGPQDESPTPLGDAPNINHLPHDRKDSKKGVSRG